MKNLLAYAWLAILCTLGVVAMALAIGILFEASKYLSITDWLSAVGVMALTVCVTKALAWLTNWTFKQLNK